VNATSLRAVVVGTGSIGGRHARNLRQVGVRHVALCDLDGARAAKLAREIDADEISVDLGELLARFRPQAVLVCTPPASHLAIAEQALAAGAHVFCEKPLAPSLDGVDRLLAQVDRSGRVLMMGMCYRFHPVIRRLREHVAAGSVGRLLAAHLWAGQYLPDWHPWADYRREYSAQRRLGGGVLLDSIHSLDTVRWALGEPVEVTGMLGKVSDLEIDTEDVAVAVLRLASGALVEVHVDYLQRHGQSRTEVVGSDGNLVVEGGGLRWRRTGDTAWTEERFDADVNAMYSAELREFVECATTGRQPVACGREGRATLALAAAVRESAETGRLVRLGACAREAAA
jgi:predicted dehydrogenase